MTVVQYWCPVWLCRCHPKVRHIYIRGFLRIHRMHISGNASVNIRLTCIYICCGTHHDKKKDCIINIMMNNIRDFDHVHMGVSAV